MYNQLTLLYMDFNIIIQEPWSEVRRELIEDKGLTADMADKLGIFVEYKGTLINDNQEIHLNYFKDLQLIKFLKNLNKGWKHQKK